MTCIKTLLGVRKTTRNVICLVEAGMPLIKSKLQDLQKNALIRLINRTQNIYGDPFLCVSELSKRKRINAYKYISSRPTCIINKLSDSSVSGKNVLRQKVGSKFDTYRDAINQELSLHIIYSDHHRIPEYQRVEFTRSRTSSHSVAIETGQWSRVQLWGSCRKTHAPLSCSLTQTLRDQSPDLDYSALTSVFHSIRIKCVIMFTVI